MQSFDILVLTDRDIYVNISIQFKQKQGGVSVEIFLGIPLTGLVIFTLHNVGEFIRERKRKKKGDR